MGESPKSSATYKSRLFRHRRTMRMISPSENPYKSLTSWALSSCWRAEMWEEPSATSANGEFYNDINEADDYRRLKKHRPPTGQSSAKPANRPPWAPPCGSRTRRRGSPPSSRWCLAMSAFRWPAGSCRSASMCAFSATTGHGSSSGARTRALHQMCDSRSASGVVVEKIVARGRRDSM